MIISMPNPTLKTEFFDLIGEIQVKYDLPNNLPMTIEDVKDFYCGSDDDFFFVEYFVAVEILPYRHIIESKDTAQACRLVKKYITVDDFTLSKIVEEYSDAIIFYLNSFLQLYDTYYPPPQ